MKRFIPAIALCMAFLTAPQGIDAQERTSSEGSVLQRLDAILDRLEKIEGRLSRLEELQLKASRWTITGDGTVWSANGREIGFWGIDIVPRVELRR